MKIWGTFHLPLTNVNDLLKLSACLGLLHVLTKKRLNVSSKHVLFKTPSLTMCALKSYKK